MSTDLNPIGLMFVLALGFLALLYLHVRDRESYPPKTNVHERDP